MYVLILIIFVGASSSQSTTVFKSKKACLAAQDGIINDLKLLKCNTGAGYSINCVPQ